MDGQRAGPAHHERAARCQPRPGFDEVAHVNVAGDRIGASPTAHAPEERVDDLARRSEEHTSDLQSLMRISYAVFCLKKNNSSTFLHSSACSTSLSTLFSLFLISIFFFLL